MQKRNVAGNARVRRLASLGVIAALSGAAPAMASPSYQFLTSIGVPGADNTTPAAFSGYDLSVFDSTSQLYYLTDRTNKAVDVFSAKTNTFAGRLTSPGLFAGSQGGNNDIAGPNGIALANTSTGKLLIAGNGPSNFVTFNLAPSGLTATSTRTTSTEIAAPSPNATPTPANRVDGVAYSPTANTILAANNASNPGFLTLVDNATGTITKSIQLNGANGFPNVAGNGVEATIYNTARDSFFVAVPTLSVDAAGAPADAGGVIELDAKTGALRNTYDFASLGLTGACSPTGLSQGAGAAMFVACSDPTATGSVLLDPAGKGSIRVAEGIRGGDQTYYDPSNNTFFEAARFQPGGPVVGIIDASTLALQTLPIGANDHAVAVDPVSNELFIATGPTTAFPGCAIGCIGVFAQATATAVPEPASLPVVALALAGLLGVTGVRRRS